MACKIESGVQLFTRLTTRPSLENINPNILINGGPFSQEVIEITGELSTGKTFFVTEFIALSILPIDYKSIKIGGKNSGVILIDTDHHFDIFRLVNVMEKLIKDCRTKVVKICSLEVEEIVQESLKNLIVLNCYDSSQMFITFYKLEEILAETLNISLIVIDSISAYYWSDTGMCGLKKFDLYLKEILYVVQNIISQFKVVLMYTKPAYVKSKIPLKQSINECSKETKIDKINYRIYLSEQDENIFKAEINIYNNISVKRYKIQSHCLQWFND